MQRLAQALLVLCLASPGLAEDRDRSRLDVRIPEIPQEHERLKFFDKKRHHDAPGTVTIDKPGYVCNVDGRGFTRRDAFVAHLRIDHHVPAERVPEVLVTYDGQVHFAGE